MRKHFQHILATTCLISGLIILLFAGGYGGARLLTPGPAPSITHALVPPALPPGLPSMLNMGMPGARTAVTDVQAPQTATHMKSFTLTAEPARLALSSNVTVDAWTFNGTAPGPTLRVQQGDLVVVKLINHLTFGITLHWHGVDVPNAADGVAGVTQDAVKSGQSYTYRFLANDPGTYWYHSHQQSYEETAGGLYGTLIVDPATPTVHDDVDLNIALHGWNNESLLALNTTLKTLSYVARPRQWVRLRFINTSINQHMVTLVGAPFLVAALDGHDLNAPTPLTAVPLLIGAAQRYDLRFQMPAHGAVTLLTSNDNQHYQQYPSVVIGQDALPAVPSIVQLPIFDFTTYGLPRPDPISLQSHFDVAYTIKLNDQMGTSLGRSGTIYTMNGKGFPNTDMIMLQQGQLVKIHLVNESQDIHPIHLHGHVFTVLTYNGKPLTGSPIHLDTINIQPHDSYDIAFFANNPGIWMLHCHNLFHASMGMDMMVMYNISTPYTIGSISGNFPD